MREDHFLLQISLETAVPLWIYEHMDKEWDWKFQRAKTLADVVASHGDDILYKSKKQGDTARAFNALAEGLALMSFVPGGVTFMGLHWETVPKEVLVEKEKAITEFYESLTDLVDKVIDILEIKEPRLARNDPTRITKGE